MYQIIILISLTILNVMLMLYINKNKNYLQMIEAEIEFTPSNIGNEIDGDRVTVSNAIEIIEPKQESKIPIFPTEYTPIIAFTKPGFKGDYIKLYNNNQLFFMEFDPVKKFYVYKYQSFLMMNDLKLEIVMLKKKDKKEETKIVKFVSQHNIPDIEKNVLTMFDLYEQEELLEILNENDYRRYVLRFEKNIFDIIGTGYDDIPVVLYKTPNYVGEENPMNFNDERVIFRQMKYSPVVYYYKSIKLNPDVKLLLRGYTSGGGRVEEMLDVKWNIENIQSFMSYLPERTRAKFNLSAGIDTTWEHFDKQIVLVVLPK